MPYGIAAECQSKKTHADEEGWAGLGGGGGGGGGGSGGSGGGGGLGEVGCRGWRGGVGAYIMLSFQARREFTLAWAAWGEPCLLACLPCAFRNGFPPDTPSE